MKARALAIAALALAAPGCGTSDEIEAPQAAEVQPARLVLHESRVTDGPVYKEGSVSYLGVGPASGGEDIHATQVDAAGTGAVIFDEQLAPGEYRIVSYQRLCDANCGSLDPPTDRCATTLDISPGETRDLTIVVRPWSQCRFTGD
jgi:hypothetical protein